MVELYINEELIDLSVDQKLAMTYQLKDIGDVKNQRADFSNQFRIPKTKENLRKLGFVDRVTSADMRPYRMLPARIIQGGEEIVRSGVCKILSAGETINIVVYSGLKDLFQHLGDSTLSELDFSEYDHRFDKDTITPLLSAVEGICYPLIDYGQLAINDLTLDYLRFAIYVKAIMEKILTTAGFTFDGSFFDHADYPKLIIPFSNQALTNKASAEAGSFLASQVGHDITTANVPITVPFIVEEGNSGNCFDGEKYTVGAYAVRGEISFNGRITRNSPVAQNISVRIRSSLRGIVAYTTENIVGASIPVKLEVPMHDYTPGEQLYVQVQHEAVEGVTVEGLFAFEQSDEVPYNGLIPVGENLPNIKQSDFLKAIAQMYGVIYDTDLNGEHLQARFFDEIQLNKGAAIDWSEKLDVKKPMEVSYNLGWARNNFFVFDNGSEKGDRNEADEGNVPFALGEGVIPIDDDTLEDEATPVKLPFAATEERINDELLGFEQPLKLPYIKIFTPTLQLTDPTFGASGNITNVPPYIYSSTFYAAPPAYNAATIYGTGKRVRYNSAVWEYQSAEAASGKLPGVDLDNADDGTAYTGLPYWKLMDIEKSFLFTQSIKIKPRILLVNTYEKNLFVQFEQYPDSFFHSDFLVPYFQGGVDFETLLAAHYKTVADANQKCKVVKAHFNLSMNDVKNIDYLIPRYVSYLGGFFYINRIEKFIKGRTTVVHLVRV